MHKTVTVPLKTNNKIITPLSKDSNISRILLAICGFYVACLGCILSLVATFTYLDPSQILQMLLGPFQEAPLDSWSWAQTAVAFGMHSYADLYSGLSMLSTSLSMDRSLPRQVYYWNTTRFVISLLWGLKFLEGTFQFNNYTHKANIFEFPGYTFWFSVLILIDACLIRPIAIYIQRLLSDAYPPLPDEELLDYNLLSSLQKFCRSFFFYEAVLSGITGAVYFIFPQLFYWLYAFPESSASFVTFWTMSQFGVLVMSFGLFQTQAEIDQNIPMVVVWLVLDLVWLYYFWVGVGSNWPGGWNPLLFQGANMWCHSAFHADSTLALMRTIYLITLVFPGEKKKKVE